MAYDASLGQRITDFFTNKNADFHEKRMFGGLCFMVSEKMCVGIIGTQLMARVGPDAYETCLQKEYCSEMDFTGRSMKGYVYVDGEGLVNDSDLEFWLETALAFNPLAKASRKKKAK